MGPAMSGQLIMRDLIWGGISLFKMTCISEFCTSLFVEHALTLLVLGGERDAKSLNKSCNNRVSDMIWLYSPPQVDRIWGIWGSYCKMPKAILYLLKGGYRV